MRFSPWPNGTPKDAALLRNWRARLNQSLGPGGANFSGILHKTK